MANSVFFALGLLLIFVVWRHVVIPSLLDHYRDKLFDLRAEVRQHFLRQADGLASREYRSLRDLLNDQIRYLERTSVFAIAFMLAAPLPKPERRDAFKTADDRHHAEHSKYFMDVRRSAALAVLSFAAQSSLTLTVASIIMAPAGLIVEGCSSLAKSGAQALGRAKLDAPTRAIVAGLALLGLQGQFRPSIESVIERAAREHARSLSMTRHSSGAFS